MTRSATAATAGLWLAIRIAAPPLARERRMAKTSDSVAVSSSPVGSSARTTSGVVGQRDRQTGAGQLTAGQLIRVRRAPLADAQRRQQHSRMRAGRPPGHPLHQLDVLLDRQVPQQIPVLIEHPNAPGPQPGAELVRADG